MKLKTKYNYLLFHAFAVLFLLFPFIAKAQTISVQADLDSTQLWIGDQTNFRFKLIQNKDISVQFPSFTDTIVGNLEIVEQGNIDTVQLPNNEIELNLSYVVTSFEDSLLYIPPFPFVVGDDTVWSNASALRVIQPFEIDTASNAITDIKPFFNAKFDWKYYAKRILIVLLIIALLVVLFYFIRKHLKSRPKEEKIVVQAKAPIIPASVEALSQLAELEVKKLWQNGQIKLYHTELTEILRIYIDKVFAINGMEMTSDEILKALFVLDKLDNNETNQLNQILKLADLVKFAKWNPAPIDNELSMKNAIQFVESSRRFDAEYMRVNESSKK